MEDISEKIGKRIITLRKEKDGLSQEKLAYKADVDRTYMTGIETGKRKVSVAVLEKIVKALDTDLASFFNDESFRYEN
ncbi:MAG: helix-turn-helix transcriptional regulator [Saprospiraceae bacterium]|nr:helix-turn-helix transcriptional regulator [Saprospiraceae bacterium]